MGPGMRLTQVRFEQLVEEALADLPARYRKLLENVVVIVENRPRSWHRALRYLRPIDPCSRIIRHAPSVVHDPIGAGAVDSRSQTKQTTESAFDSF